MSVLTTGHDKLRVTVMLTARDNGSKLLPFVLLPRKRPDAAIEKKFSGKLTLCWAGKIWMDDWSTGEYLRRVIGEFAFGNRILVWDSFRLFLYF